MWRYECNFLISLGFARITRGKCWWGKQIFLTKSIFMIRSSWTVFKFWSNRESCKTPRILLFSVFDRETIHCFLYFTIINEHINNLFIENAIINANRKDFFDLVKSRTWKFLMTLLLVFFFFFLQIINSQSCSV